MEQEKFKLIYADPPWKFKSKNSGGTMVSGASAKYDVMTLDELKALPVPEWADKDCALCMWYVSSQPEEAIELAKAWGFKMKTMNLFVWDKETATGKDHFGMGYYTRGSVECILLATRGRTPVLTRSMRQIQRFPVREHSQKPDEFRDLLIELFGDVPRLEMFARTDTPGWSLFGNEVESFIPVKPAGWDDLLDGDWSSPYEEL